MIATGRIAALQAFEFHPQHRALQRVHALIETDDVVVMFARRAPVAQQAQLRGELVALRGDGAGIAVSAEVLRRVEAEAAQSPEAPGGAAAVLIS